MKRTVTTGKIGEEKLFLILNGVQDYSGHSLWFCVWKSRWKFQPKEWNRYGIFYPNLVQITPRMQTSSVFLEFITWPIVNWCPSFNHANGNLKFVFLSKCKCRLIKLIAIYFCKICDVFGTKIFVENRSNCNIFLRKFVTYCCKWSTSFVPIQWFLTRFTAIIDFSHRKT